MNLPEPRTTKGIVLNELLTRRAVTEQEVKLNGFRARISELRKKDKVNIEGKELKFINRLGKKARCYTYSIPIDDRDKALEVYLKINH